MLDFIAHYWLEVIFGGCLALLSFLYRRILKKIKEQEYVKDGVQAILHDRLWQVGEYYISKGEITLNELKNIEYMYTAYHNLGGNSTGTEIFERVKNLEIKSEKE